MRCEYVYGVITNLEYWCITTGSRAYQVSWAYSHLSIRNAFLSLISPVFEHDLEVIKFLDEIDDGEDKYFTNQFKRVDDAWKIVEFCGPKCEFCEGFMCDRMEYKEELEDMLRDVGFQVGTSKQKRFMMYRKFTFVGHSYLGKNERREVDYCVRDIIHATFPVKKGKRKRGFEAFKNHN